MELQKIKVFRRICYSCSEQYMTSTYFKVIYEGTIRLLALLLD
jgi:hypothetical protein